MDAGSTVGGYVAALKRSERLGDQVVHHRTIQELAARCAPNVRPWPRAVQNVLRDMGIEELYSHQARATDLVRSGRHVVVATPTASGKTLIYNLPVLERFLGDPECRALYLFPLKALAQDQLRNFEALTAAWPRDARPRAAIYDGDTTDYKRRKIRENPPNVLLTNPEMLHLSICPHHDSWSAFLADLQFVVVDEVHTYRGVLGSHMAQVFRRLRRICERFGARPTFIFCSATVANPEELAGQLTGLEVETITESGAPQGARHFVFLNPYEGAAQASILLLQAALHRGLRTIVYTQSRKITELVSLWAQQRSGPFKDRISAYRSGFLPEERREIEARMNSGELLAVVSTSALELGIDIGALDICILVGYPGTVMATLQRGGRVGRSLRESAVLMLAHEDALDQYFMRNPSAFFDKGPEAAVLNPCNPVILSRHLECAAAEMPLRDEENWLSEPKVLDVVRRMERSGQLLRGADGAALYSRRKRPQREINLRGAGSVYHIEIGAHQKGGASVGTVDEHRAFKETHPGAVYLHRGVSYVVADLNLATRNVRVERQKVNYFTRPRVTKETEIIEVLAEKPVWGARLFLGRLKVTETVTGYETRQIRGSKLLRITNLDLPPLIFETEGIWIVIPPDVQRAAEDEFLHFMGGIHALEHAAIGIMPLQVMTDRNDLGGISTPMHPQLGMSAVFIYDGIPGGVGLTRQAYAKPEELLERTLGVITSCDCEFGCPACVHSPKCGSGNRPIDKNAALRILHGLHEAPTMAPLHLEMPQGSAVAAARSLESSINPEVMHELQGRDRQRKPTDTPPRFGVLDVETRRSAAEVGGWHRADRMGVSVAVLYDSADAGFHVFLEQDMHKLMQHLKDLELVVGFNVKRFDYKVLSAYAGKERFDRLPTLDMLDVIQQRLGYRLSLDHLAKATLMAEKTADGLQALAWWAEGRVQKIIDYCTKDVAITRDLYLHGRDKGYLLFTNKARKLVRLPVEW
jgi:DEAD/DEAH box helicase domain-containing protein